MLNNTVSPLNNPFSQRIFHPSESAVLHESTQPHNHIPRPLYPERATNNNSSEPIPTFLDLNRPKVAYTIDPKSGKHPPLPCPTYHPLLKSRNCTLKRGCSTQRLFSCFKGTGWKWLLCRIWLYCLLAWASLSILGMFSSGFVGR